MADVGRSRRGANRSDAARLRIEEAKRKHKTGELLQDEARVYDVVDEEQYEEIVAKRRQQGSFIENDNGVYQDDFGEEEDWDVAEDTGGDDVEDADEHPKKKRKGDAKGPKEKAKADAAAKHRMQKMFAAAAPKSRVTPKSQATDQSSDDLLNALLSGGGPASSPSARVMATPRRAPLPHRCPVSGPYTTPRPSPSSHPRSFTAATPRTLGTPLPNGSAGNPAHAPPSGKGGMRAPSTLSRMKREAPSRSPSPPPQYNDDAAMPDYGGDEADVTPVPSQEREEAEATEAMDAEPTLVAVASPTAPTVARVKQEDVDNAASPVDAKTSAAPSRPPMRMLYADTPEGPQQPSGWDSTYDNTGSVAEAEEEKPWVDDGSLPLEEGRALRAHLLDAHEEIGRPGTVYLFCKVLLDNHWLSTCVVVPVPQRTFFVVPHPSVLHPHREELKRLQEAAEGPDASAQDRLAPVMYLQKEVFPELKQELREGLLSGVERVGMRPVMRDYAFERSEIPHGRQWVLKVKVPASTAPLPFDVKGDLFVAVLGGGQTSMEALLLKRRIKGPCWLTLAEPSRVDPHHQVSHCKLEVTVGSPKAVTAVESAGKGRAPLMPGQLPPRPPLSVAALNLRTWTNPATGAAEIVAASVVHMAAVRQDVPLNKEHWKSSTGMKNFSIVRKLDGHPFPAGFEAKVAEINKTPRGRANGGAMRSALGSEKALLTALVGRLAALDPDALVGHNISAFDLDVLLHRLSHHKVFQWSRIGRLKRTAFPSLKGGGHTFGGGAGAGALSAIAGRLLCDTYLSARELKHATEYTLASLSADLLQEHKPEVNSSDVAGKYESAEELEGLVKAGEADGWLSLGLAAVLNVLPLSAQLATVSGSLWSAVLQGQRARRIEMLLAHEFHARKFMLPDRLSAKERDRQARANGEEAAETTAGGKRKAAYEGGLVLQPKEGLHDSFTLLLDFNSLYPSIIREYGICFTTVDRGNPGELPGVVPGRAEAPLPAVLAAILGERKKVKNLLKNPRLDPLKQQQYDTQQLALKLTANSMYGCLGFRASRFYAQPLAELITATGRDILMATKSVVEDSLGYDVIYGDTDSIMVNTRCTDVAKSREIASQIIRKVNAPYSKLELALDGMYKVILLLKKKKYAAIKLETDQNGTPFSREVREEKGLDQVRRDWSPLSKISGRFVLGHILSGAPREDVVAAIHAHLRQVADKVNAREVPLQQYVITKQLTKRPEEYPDAKNQPHVQVAMRRKAAGRRNGIAQGETVPYIICMDLAEGGDAAAGSGGSKGLAQRAYHMDEIRAPGSQLVPDAAYYLGHQVHPVVSRLCESIEGTDAAHIADCLGLDPARFSSRGGGSGGGSSEDARDDALISGASYFDDPARFKDCERLQLTAGDGTEFFFCGVESLVEGAIDATTALQPAHAAGTDTAPLTGPQVANQATLAARRVLRQYYDGELRSDNQMDSTVTRDLCLRVGPDGRPGSGSTDPSSSAVMSRVMTESAVYTQLSALHRSLDVRAALARLPKSADVAEAEKRVLPVRPHLDAAAAAVDSIRSAMAYRWVRLLDVCC